MDAYIQGTTANPDFLFPGSLTLETRYQPC
jgi:hypothetical protein